MVQLQPTRFRAFIGACRVGGIFLLPSQLAQAYVSARGQTLTRFRVVIVEYRIGGCYYRCRSNLSRRLCPPVGFFAVHKIVSSGSLALCHSGLLDVSVGSTSYCYT